MAIQLSQRERLIFFLCLATVTVYLGYTFFYLPLEEKQTRIQGEILALEKRLQREMEVISHGKGLKGESLPLLKVFEQKGTDEEVMATVLKQIEDTAGRFNFQISQLKPRKVRRVDFYSHFAVSLTIEAELEEVLHFLYSLQDEPYYFTVDEAIFDKRLPNSPILRAQLVLGKSLIP